MKRRPEYVRLTPRPITRPSFWLIALATVIGAVRTAVDVARSWPK